MEFATKLKIKFAVEKAVRENITFQHVVLKLGNSDQNSLLFHDYIAHIYVKCCLANIENYAKNFLSSASTADTCRFFESLRNNTVPQFFSECHHFELLNSVLETRSEEETAKVYSDLKNVLFSAYSNRWRSRNDTNSSSEEQHPKFIDVLINYLLDYKTQFLQNPISVSNSFQESDFLTNWYHLQLKALDISHKLSAHHSKLKSTLDTEWKIFANSDDHFKWIPQMQVICNVLQSQSSVEQQVDSGKRLLLVRNHVMVLSKCLEEVEASLPSVQEVQFHASKIFYADASLANAKWHGKNIAVITPTFHCIEWGVIWDVSGHHGKVHTVKHAPNGKKPGEDGADGENGFCGESGGNVTLVAGRFINIIKLKIYSNGGNGSTGQYGGHGADGAKGKDGIEMSLVELKQDFPSPVYRWSNDGAKLKKIIQALLRDKTSVERKVLLKLDENGDKIGKGPKRSAFIRGVYGKRYNFEFSFSQWTFSRCVYLLFRGSLGEPGQLGGSGGLNGLPGEGGYGGTIEAIDFQGNKYSEQPITFNVEGWKGATLEDCAKRGKTGEPGKVGKDIGYFHSSKWIQSDPEYMCGDYVNVMYSSKWSRNSVWCEGLNSYMEMLHLIPPQLVGSVIPTNTKLRQNINQTTARRQTAIDITRALEYYATSSVDNIFHRMSTTVDGQITDQSNLEVLRNSEASMLSSGNQIQFSKESYQYCHTTFYVDPVQTKDKVASKLALLDMLPPLTQSKECDCQLEKNPNWKHFSFIKETHFNLLKVNYKQKLGSAWQETVIKTPISSLAELLLNKVRRVNDDAQMQLCHVLDSAFKKLVNDTKNCSVDMFTALQHALKKKSNLLKQKISENGEITNVQKRQQLDELKIVEDGHKTLNWQQQLRKPEFQENLKMYLDIVSKSSLSIYDFQLLAASLNWKVTTITKATSNTEYSKSGHIVLLNKGALYFELAKDFKHNWNLAYKCLSPEIANYYQQQNGVVNGVCLHLKQLISNLLTTAKKERDFKYFCRMALVWPMELLKLFFDILNSYSTFSNSTEYFRVNQLLYELITESFQKDVSNPDVVKWFHIMLTSIPNFWPRYICLALLENKCAAEHEKTKTLIENYELLLFKTEISKIPLNFTICLAEMIKNNPDKFGNEFRNGILKKDLMENVITKFPWIKGENCDLSVLDGLYSIELWVQQLRKVDAMLNLKDLLKSVKWDGIEDRLEQVFYYYYRLKEKRVSQEKRDWNDDEDFNRILQALNTKAESSKPGTISKIISAFYSERWKLDAHIIEKLVSCTTLDAFISHMEDAERNYSTVVLENLFEILKRDTLVTLPENTLQETVNILKENLIKYTTPDLPRKNPQTVMTAWLATFEKDVKSCSTLTGEQRVTQRPLLICRGIIQIEAVIYYIFQHKFYCTQKLAILFATLLTKKEAKSAEVFQNLLMQVKTGEGKSYIVLAVAIIRGLFGQCTDVITSSSHLAQRDAMKFRQVYELFGLSVGTVTMESVEQRTREYSKTVLYGEISQFIRDFLLDKFYEKNIRGSREQKNVTVDEVDSQLLDKANDVLYLSHSPLGMELLEVIFLTIWQQTIYMLKHNNYQPLEIYNLILSMVYPVLHKSDLQTESPVNQMTIWNILLNHKAIDDNGRIKVNYQNVRTMQLPSDVLDRVRKLLENKIHHHSITGIIQSNSLRQFIELHLLTWIRSAYIATQYTEGKEYVLHSGYFDAEVDKHLRIVIIDKYTGTDLKHTQLGNALHQFLQLKHGCKLESLSLKSVFISNKAFLQQYDSLLGLTGTLGSGDDKLFLKDNYGVYLVVIPSVYPNKFIEEEPILCLDSEKWKQEIAKDIKEKLNKGRSILVICEYITEVDALYVYLMQTCQFDTKSINIFRRDVGSFSKKFRDITLPARSVIISTNLAGRGADFVLSPQLKIAGGLHVIFSYVSSNLRVCLQGFGRAARNGDPGSGRVIFQIPSDSEAAINKIYPIYNAMDFISHKDKEEKERLSFIRNHNENVIKLEEAQFEKFRDNIFHKVRQADKEFRKTEGTEESLDLDSVKGIIMQNVLDLWAFWLDEYSTTLVLLNKCDSNEQQRFYSNQKLQILEKFKDLEKIPEDIGEWLRSITFWSSLTNKSNINSKTESLINTPALLNKLGLICLKFKKYGLAQKYFRRTMEMESENSFFYICASMYFLFALAKYNSRFVYDRVQAQATTTLELLQNYILQQVMIPEVNETTGKLFQAKSFITEGLQKQKEAQFDILLKISDNLEQAFGKTQVEPVDFLNLVEGNMSKACILFNELQTGTILRCPSINEFSMAKLQVLSIRSNVPVDKLKNIFEDSSSGSLSKETLSEIETGLDLPSVDGFWTSIQHSIQQPKRFVLIPKSKLQIQNANQFENQNDYRKWKESIEVAHPGGIILSTSPTPLAEFLGVVQEVLADDDESQDLPDCCIVVDVALLDTKKFAENQPTSYHQVIATDLQQIPNLDSKYANDLFDELVLTKIVNVAGILLTTDFSLLFAKKRKHTFAKFDRVLQQEVLSFVQSRCCYKYEQLRLLDEIRKVQTVQSPSTELQIQLDKNPFAKFIFHATKLGIMKGVQINPQRVENKFPISPDDNWLVRNIETDCITSLDMTYVFPNSTGRFHQKALKDMHTRGWVMSRTSRSNFYCRSNSNWKISINEPSIQNAEIEQNARITQNDKISMYELKLARILTLISVKLKLGTNAFRHNLLIVLKHLAGNYTVYGESCLQLKTLSFDLFKEERWNTTHSIEYKRLSVYGLDNMIQSTKGKITEMPTLLVCSTGLLLLGVSEIGAGIMAIQTGFGLPLGVGAISDGLCDIWSVSKALCKSNFELTPILQRKALSLISIGIGAGVSFTALKGLEKGIRPVVTAAKILQNVRTMVQNLVYSEAFIVLVTNGYIIIRANVVQSIGTVIQDRLKIILASSDTFPEILQKLLDTLSFEQAKSLLLQCSAKALRECFEKEECLKNVSSHIKGVLEQEGYKLSDWLCQQNGKIAGQEVNQICQALASSIKLSLEQNGLADNLLEMGKNYVRDLTASLEATLEEQNAESSVSIENKAEELQELEQEVVHLVEQSVEKIVEQGINEEHLYKSIRKLASIQKLAKIKCWIFTTTSENNVVGDSDFTNEEMLWNAENEIFNELAKSLGALVPAQQGSSTTPSESEEFVDLASDALAQAQI